MTAANADQAPLLDGRYRLGECVGEGGMARVYRAEDVALGRTVAIKLIRPGVDGASSARARSEMTVLASLNHPSLVTLFDARLEPGQPEYLSMEFVDGPTLASRLASAGPLPSEDVAHLASELAEALHVVHDAGVVHRDIKPSNVLMSPAPLPGARPRAKLADFGIAYLLDTSRITTPGLVIGTVAYLAPEQIRGADPVPASDVYSLGLVLVEALTGERAHPQGAGIEATLSRLESPPPVPTGFGDGWTDLLTHMLDPDASRRPTAAEVARTAVALAGPSTTAQAPHVTGVTMPVTGPTLVAPLPAVSWTAGTLSGAGAGGYAPAAASASAPASVPVSASGSAAARRRRRRWFALVAGGIAALLLVGAAVLAFSSLGAPQPQPQPEPAMTVLPPPPAPSDAPADDDTGADDDAEQSGLTDEQRKAAEDAQKKAEREQRRLERDQRKEDD
jgi:hypothetical protein